MAKTIGFTLVIFLLTILTQIGGLVFLFAWMFGKFLKTNFRFKALLIFLSFYVLSTFLVVPFVAKKFGREKILNNENVRPVSFLTILFNRNYVKPQLNEILTQSADFLKSSNIQIRYLDANFPFYDGFPLLPHLSHNDGKKLDLSFVYQTEDGRFSNLKKSNSGYGIFENPNKTERNQTEICKKNKFWQYDYSKYLSFGKKNEQLIFSAKGSQMLINTILKHSTVEKIFIEPHLKVRMNLTDERIRFQGCHSIRHDDHIHIQIK